MTLTCWPTARWLAVSTRPTPRSLTLDVGSSLSMRTACNARLRATRGAAMAAFARELAAGNKNEPHRR
jgi:hypothetical protein